MDAIRLRLRADVPVASYLSGGIDSSIITALVKKYHNNSLKSFSVTFADEGYEAKDLDIAVLKLDRDMSNQVGGYASFRVGFPNNGQAHSNGYDQDIREEYPQYQDQQITRTSTINPYTPLIRILPYQPLQYVINS